MLFKKLIIVGTLIVFSYANVGQAAAKWNDLNSGEYQYKELKSKTIATGPTLIFSDSPEYVRDYGVLYEDRLQGDIRIFYYHVNDKWPTARIAIVVQNEALQPVTLTVGKQGKPKPSPHWQLDGKRTQQLYFDKHKSYETKLEMYEKIELLSGKNGLVYAQDELAQGIIEMQSSGPVRIKIISLPTNAEVFEYMDIAARIPADDVRLVPLRGTFPKADRKITLEPLNFKAGLLGITLADGVRDKFARGQDAMTDKVAENYGNYGVFYEVDFENKSRDKFAVRLNGTGGLIAGQVLISDQEGKNISKIDFPAQNQILFSGSGLETVLLGEFPGRFKGKIIFSPPGTGNLPITLLFYKIKE